MLARVVKWRNSIAEQRRISRVVGAMIRVIALAMMGLAAPLGAQPAATALKPMPAALNLFERDWVLMNWALKFYDRDRDIMLEPAEAEAAAAEFRNIADSNGDGRVTPNEYREAREFILARY